MSGKILLIDADPTLTEILMHYLEQEGYSAIAVHDGEIGLKKAINQHFDAIILDILLSKINGFEIVKTLRLQSDVPVLILTARKDDIDRLIALEIGADDFLTKPCNPYELIARLNAILRRSQKNPTQRPTIKHHDLVLDCTTRQASQNDQPLDLTNTEFNILEILMKSPGQAFSKEELTEYALGRKYTAFDRSIDVHISNLRNKLGDNGQKETRVKTVRGFGYSFNA